MTKRQMLPIDYVTKDFEGFKQLMLEQIPIIAPEWTDTSKGDFGIVLMELLCYGLDILSFYQDKAVNESFLPTARTRKSVTNICELLGYKLKQQSPSVFKLVFRKLDEFKDEDIVIPAKTLVGTDPKKGNPIQFEVSERVLIPAGAMGDEKDSKGNYIYATTCSQGCSIVDELGNGNGEAFQKFKLHHDNVILNTLKIWTNENGVKKEWSQKNDFLSSTEVARDFITHTNEQTTVVEFGDGYSGLRVGKFVPVVAEYRIGGGSIGNVGINSINSFLGEEIVGIDTMFNPELPIKYGMDIESIEHAKILAPKLFKTNDRAVTKEDFEALSIQYDGVVKAKCIETFNENGDVLIYVADSGYRKTSSDFKDGLKSYLDTKKLINNNVIVKDAEYKEFDVTITATTYMEYAEDEVKEDITKKLRKFLDINNFEFGDELRKAQIVKFLMLMDSVQDVEIEEPIKNIVPKEIEILKLRNLNVKVIGGIK